MRAQQQTNEMENNFFFFFVSLKKCTFFSFAFRWNLNTNFASTSNRAWVFVRTRQSSQPTARRKTRFFRSMEANNDETRKEENISRALLLVDNRFNNLSFILLNAQCSFSLFIFLFLFLYHRHRWYSYLVRQQWSPHHWLKYSNYHKTYYKSVFLCFFRRKRKFLFISRTRMMWLMELMEKQCETRTDYNLYQKWDSKRYKNKTKIVYVGIVTAITHTHTHKHAKQ